MERNMAQRSYQVDVYITAQKMGFELTLYQDDEPEYCLFYTNSDDAAKVGNRWLDGKDPIDWVDQVPDQY
jgi:hypothetical protein